MYKWVTKPSFIARQTSHLHDSRKEFDYISKDVWTKQTGVNYKKNPKKWYSGLHFVIITITIKTNKYFKKQRHMSKVEDYVVFFVVFFQILLFFLSFVSGFTSLWTRIFCYENDRNSTLWKIDPARLLV